MRILARAAAIAALSAACGSSGAPVIPAETVEAPVSDAGLVDVASAAPDDAAPMLDAGPPSVDATATCSPTPAPACDSSPPSPGPARTFHNAGSSALTVFGANHRGRDLFLKPGDPQWVMAMFAYGQGPAESALTDEDVDVWLDRDCGSQWEKLGTALTTATASHAPVEGIDDAPGRIFFRIPTNQALGVGRHRVRLVVGGDLSFTELFIEVVPPGMPMFAADIDGTLTVSEGEEFLATLSGALSAANEGSADALTALASKGYRPFYLSERPEWLVERTRQFIHDRGFPPGIIHTTVGVSLPVPGPDAQNFKTAELASLAAKGLHAGWAFGNTDTDSGAYGAAQVLPLDHRIFFQYGDPDGGLIAGGRRIESYLPLIPEFKALAPVCP